MLLPVLLRAGSLGGPLECTTGWWMVQKYLVFYCFFLNFHVVFYNCFLFRQDFCQDDEVVRSVQMTSPSGAVCYGLGESTILRCLCPNN